MHTSRLVRSITAVTLAAASLAACGSSSGGAGGGGPSGGDDLVIGALVPATSGTAYTASYTDAAKAKAKKLGVELKVYDAKYSASTQASQADELFAQKPDGVFLSPAAVDAAGPIIAKANALKIPILISNTEVSADLLKKAVLYTGPPNKQQGEEAAKLLAKALNNTGNVIVIGGFAGYSVTNDREAGLRDELKKIAPDMTVLASQPADWDKVKAISATTSLLTKYGDKVDGVFAMSDDMAVGAAEAVKKAGLDPTTIPVVGVGFSTSGQAGLKDKSLYGTVLQSARTDGEYAVEYLVKYLRGEKFDTKEIFIPSPQITAENMDEYTPDWG